MNHFGIISVIQIFTTPYVVKNRSFKAVVRLEKPINGVQNFFLTESEVRNLSSCVNGLFGLLPSLAVGGTLQVEVSEHKLGDTWENKSTGETGVYTKDWTETRVRNLTLSLQAAATLAVVSMQAQPVQTSAPAKVEQPIVEGVNIP